VTVVEYLDAITPGMDGEGKKNFMRIFSKKQRFVNFVIGGRAVQGHRSEQTKAPK